ncbi:PTS sugar transporter subunit IIB [Salmonella enterica subsp. enterica serovar Georgia]|nr:PTS sugar transporter subunit IIB [Salmonella enterica subsp. enterica serovar Georgia]
MPGAAKKICLICGSGVSSAFLAINVRKAAAKICLDVIVENRPETDFKKALGEFDSILIAPHLEFLLKDFHLSAEDYCRDVQLIPFSIYGTLDGNLILNMLQEFKK